MLAAPWFPLERNGVFLILDGPRLMLSTDLLCMHGTSMESAKRCLTDDASKPNIHGFLLHSEEQAPELGPVPQELGARHGPTDETCTDGNL